MQGADVVAKLADCDDRDVAASFKGQIVAVPRDAFPPAEEGEYYWADLVGLKVRNTEGLDFGVVTSMLDTGANAVMVVQVGQVAQVVQQAGQPVVQQSAVDRSAERLIPFIASVIKRVDIAAGLIEVQWDEDY